MFPQDASGNYYKQVVKIETEWIGKALNDLDNDLEIKLLTLKSEMNSSNLL